MSFARSIIMKFSSDRNLGGYMPQFTVARLMTITEYTFLFISYITFLFQNDIQIIKIYLIKNFSNETIFYLFIG